MTTEAQRLAEELAHIDHERWDVLDRAARELRRIDFELACANNAIIARDDREDKHLAALRQAREALEVATRVANCAYNTGQGSEQWESGIRPTIHEFDKARRNAIATINELLGEQT